MKYTLHGASLPACFGKKRKPRGNLHGVCVKLSNPSLKWEKSMYYKQRYFVICIFFVLGFCYCIFCWWRKITIEVLNHKKLLIITVLILQRCLLFALKSVAWTYTILKSSIASRSYVMMLQFNIIPLILLIRSWIRSVNSKKSLKCNGQ